MKQFTTKMRSQLTWPSLFMDKFNFAIGELFSENLIKMKLLESLVFLLGSQEKKEQ